MATPKKDEVFEVCSWAALHTGGSKFYEAVHIKNHRTQNQVHINRFGKVAALTTVYGGEVLLRNEPMSAWQKKKHDKEKGNNRGAYTGAVALPKDWLSSDNRYRTLYENDALQDALQAQYGSEGAKRIYHLLMEGWDEDIEIVEEMPTPEEEKAIAAKQRDRELDLDTRRGPEWGTW